MRLPAVENALLPYPQSSRARRRGFAIGGSIALHVAVLLGLSALRPSLEPGTGASPRYLEIAVVDGRDELETGAAAPERLAASAGGPPDAGAPAASAPDTPPASPTASAASRLDPLATEPAPADTAIATPETARPIADPVPPAADPAPATADPARPAADPALATANPTPPTADPAALRADSDSPADSTAVDPTVSADPSDDRSGTDDAAPAPEGARLARNEPRRELPSPSAAAASSTTEARRDTTAGTPAPEPVTEPMPEAESSLLTERVEKWAESFAALGDWTEPAHWEDAGGAYSATVAFAPGADSSGYDAAVVTITTERDGRTLSTRVRLQRLGFSHYAQFVDRWDPEVQIHDDEIDGRFHTNSAIQIQRSGGVQPVFLGRVTTARTIDTSRSERRIRRDEIFLGGLETRVTRIPLPAHVELFDAAEPEPEHVLRFDGDTRIRFAGDGTYDWSPILSRRESRSGTVSGAGGRGRVPVDAPLYVVATAGATLKVAGTVDGRVLIYASGDIVVEGNLVYATPAVDGRDSDDFLGLVADGDVAVAQSDVTGPGDLEIDAAIFARRRFAVWGFRARRTGELRIVGSLTAGSLTATEPRYSTRLVYDDRLTATRPPRFPVTNRYEIDDWDRRWSTTDAGATADPEAATGADPFVAAGTAAAPDTGRVAVPGADPLAAAGADRIAARPER